jgi:iron complex outermembrane receptor protein
MIGVCAVLSAALVAAAPASEPDAAQGDAVPTPTPSPEQDGLTDATASPFFFGEIVVVDEGRDPSSGTVDVIGAETIRRSGAVTVGDVLGLMPGVSLSVGGRAEQKIWVRGYEQSNVLVLVDGVPVADPYFGDLDLGQLPVFDVARVSVTRGAASPLYGPNGLAGVVNITTRAGGGAPAFFGDLRLTGERTALLHGGAEGGAGGLDWYVGLGAETSDGWPLSGDFEPTGFEDGGTRVNSDQRRATAMGRLSWKLSDRGTLHASLRFIDAEKGVPFHTSNPVGFIKFSRFSEWRQSTLALGYEHDGGGAHLRAQLYGHGFDNTLDVYAGPELETLRLSSAFDDRVYGAYGVGEWALGRGHVLGAALHARQDRHRKTERFPDGSEDPNERYVAWNWSISAEDRWQIDGRTRLVSSVAVEGLSVSEAWSLRDDGGGPGLVADDLSSDTLVSPQIEVRRDLGRRWGASAALYRRGRFPTMRQLYGTDPPSPGLDPQTTTGVDVGVELAADPVVTIRGTVFANRVTDLITRQGRDVPYLNQDEARIDGVELRAHGSFGILDYSASWTGLDHRFTLSSEGFDEIPYVPDHQVELLGTVHLGDRFELNGVWRYTGERVAYDLADTIELDGFSILDLGAAARFGSIEVSVQLDNVLDANVEMEPGYLLPGRRVWIGCRFRLGV